MTQDQCNELRDLLFGARFASGHSEDVFRFLAVLPGGEGGGSATVHYAYAPPVWTRAGQSAPAEELLRGLIAKTDFANERLDLKFHDYLRDGWHLPWKLTAKSSTDDFPTLVLIERPGGGVTGALMRDPHTGRTLVRIAEAAEPGEAEATIALLRALPVDAKHLTWYKDSNIDALSVADAVAQTPETEYGQKALLVYRDAEWLSGLWNNPAKGKSGSELNLHSVADFHGTPVSAAKRATRPGLGVARQSQTIPGDLQVLGQALLELPLHWRRDDFSGDYESFEAVQTLCAWWNANAPAEMRQAGLFRTYIWAEADQVFVPGDPEEPVVRASLLAEDGVFALFEKEGRPPVAIQFHRGRAFNTESGLGGTQTYLANGAEAMDIGMDLEDVNEAYYAVLGLQSVRSHGY
jgi:hypothetical protein